MAEKWIKAVALQDLMTESWIWVVQLVAIVKYSKLHLKIKTNQGEIDLAVLMIFIKKVLKLEVLVKSYDYLSKL